MGTVARLVLRAVFVGAAFLLPLGATNAQPNPAEGPEIRATPSPNGGFLAATRHPHPTPTNFAALFNTSPAGP